VHNRKRQYVHRIGKIWKLQKYRPGNDSKSTPVVSRSRAVTSDETSRPPPADEADERKLSALIQEYFELSMNNYEFLPTSVSLIRQWQQALRWAADAGEAVSKVEFGSMSLPVARGLIDNAFRDIDNIIINEAVHLLLLPSFFSIWARMQPLPFYDSLSRHLLSCIHATSFRTLGAGHIMTRVFLCLNSKTYLLEECIDRLDYIPAAILQERPGNRTARFVLDQQGRAFKDDTESVAGDIHGQDGVMRRTRFRQGIATPSLTGSLVSRSLAGLSRHSVHDGFRPSSPATSASLPALHPTIRTNFISEQPSGDADQPLSSAPTAVRPLIPVDATNVLPEPRTPTSSLQQPVLLAPKSISSPAPHSIPETPSLVGWLPCRPPSPGYIAQPEQPDIVMSQPSVIKVPSLRRQTSASSHKIRLVDPSTAIYPTTGNYPIASYPVTSCPSIH
jgi:hypothetical protein